MSKIYDISNNIEHLTSYMAYNAEHTTYNPTKSCSQPGFLAQDSVHRPVFRRRRLGSAQSASVRQRRSWPKFQGFSRWALGVRNLGSFCLGTLGEALLVYTGFGEAAEVSWGIEK